MNLQFVLMKFLVAVWSRISPKTCAHFLIKLIFKVRRKNYKTNQLPGADSILYLDNYTTLHGWLGEESKAVLFVHGWNGAGEQFFELFNMFKNNGYSIYLVQPKGYGTSLSQTSNPGDFIRSIGTCLKYIDKPLVATIGHSMGAGALLYIASRRIGLGKIVSISAPSDFSKILSDFCNKLSVSEKAQQLFYSIAEKEIRIRNSELQIEHCVKRIRNPTLFIHDEEDAVLTYQNAISLHSSMEGSELYITKGLGHSRILNSKAVLDKVFKFCNEDY